MTKPPSPYNQVSLMLFFSWFDNWNIIKYTSNINDSNNNNNCNKKEGERNKTQEKQVMHNRVAQHPLNYVQPPANSPQFMHWAWCSVEEISLWPVWGMSWPGAPSAFAAGGAGDTEKCLTQGKLSNNWDIRDLSTLFSHWIKHSIVPATRKKIESIPNQAKSENHIISVRCNQEQYCSHIL